MKKITLLSLCALLAVGANANAQSSKKGKMPMTATEQAAPHKDVKMADWPQLKAFHAVMSQTFHPAEEGKFEPIRERSGELMARMKDLIGNQFPEPYRTADMKVLVAKLHDQVMKVDQTVQAKASDKEVMAALSDAHDAFHNIVGLCRKESEAH